MTMGWFDDIVSKESLTAFIFSNYCETGQFRANLSSPADLLQTHFALAVLSLLRHQGVEAIHPSLGFVRNCIPDRIRIPGGRNHDTERRAAEYRYSGSIECAPGW
jgi:prenyltransferase beta subunit